MENELYCKHRNTQLSSHFGQLSCPADQALRVANSLLNRIEWQDAAYVQKCFDSELQTCLRMIYPGVLVIWDAVTEKAGTFNIDKEINTDRNTLDIYFNKILVDLHNRFHSQPFLIQLIRYSALASSHIFTLNLKENSIYFNSIFRETLDNTLESLNSGTQDFNCLFQPSSGQSLEEFYRDFFSRWQFSLTEQTIMTACREVEEYIGSWASHKTIILPPHKDTAFQAMTEPNRKILEYEENRAVQHFALMGLFMLHNKFAKVTYLLAPTRDGRHESSLVIYWPKTALAHDTTEEAFAPDRSFLYLLKLLLGQNASQVLLAVERAEFSIKANQKMMTHFGHTMGHRLATVLNFFDDKASFADARSNAQLLSDTTVLLQLVSIDTLEALLNEPEQKRRRFIDLDENYGELDIQEKILTEWAPIVTSGVIGRDEGGKQIFCKVKLKFDGKAEHAKIGFVYHDLVSMGFRLKEPIYRELFMELLLNAARHGVGSDISEGEHNVENVNVVTVPILLGWQNIDVCPSPVLILENIYGAKKFLKELSSPTWARWPSDQLHNGPDLAITVIRKLGMGDLWYQNTELKVDGMEQVKGIFKVAIHLSGFPM